MEDGKNEKRRNTSMVELQDAMNNFPVLMQAVSEQSKRAMRKMKQMEDDMIALMEKNLHLQDRIVKLEKHAGIFDRPWLKRIFGIKHFHLEEKKNESANTAGPANTATN